MLGTSQQNQVELTQTNADANPTERTDTQPDLFTNSAINISTSSQLLLDPSQNHQLPEVVKTDILEKLIQFGEEKIPASEGKI